MSTIQLLRVVKGLLRNAHLAEPPQLTCRPRLLLGKGNLFLRLLRLLHGKILIIEINFARILHFSVEHFSGRRSFMIALYRSESDSMTAPTQTMLKLQIYEVLRTGAMKCKQIKKNRVYWNPDWQRDFRQPPKPSKLWCIRVLRSFYGTKYSKHDHEAESKK